jgi:hypothetical protein
VGLIEPDVDLIRWSTWEQQGGYGVRGGLDDALARMARWEELRRRTEDSQTGSGAAVEDLVETVRRVVERRPGLAVTVTVEYGENTASLRVEHQDGQVGVTVSQVEPAGDLRSRPLSRPANGGVPLATNGGHSPAYPARLGGDPPFDHGQATYPAHFDASQPGESDQTLPLMGDGPVHLPRHDQAARPVTPSWPPDPNTTASPTLHPTGSPTAARLADLLRQDPSLLNSDD